MKFLSLFSSFALLSLISASKPNPALSRRDVATGNRFCKTYMCASATVNGTSVQYVLSSTGKETPGWMAIGFGQRMAGTEMVMLWANSDNTITLSQRKATGESQPQYESAPTNLASLSDSLSTTSGNVQYAFTMDLPSSSSQTVIYAFGDKNPGSAAKDASLDIHLEYGIGTFTLAADSTGSGSDGSDGSDGYGGYGGGSDSGTSSSNDDSSFIPLAPYEKLIVAHGIFCVIGFMLFLPAGALLARYLRTFSPAWYTGHWVLQFALGGSIITVGFALGIAAVNSIGGLHFNDAHKQWGLAIFVIYLVQCALGAVIHWVKPKGGWSKRPPQNYFHAILGLATIALAFYQVRTGYNDEWLKVTGRPQIAYANTIWLIWVIVLPILYAAGMAFIRRQYKQEAEGRNKQSMSQFKGDKEYVNMSNVQISYPKYPAYPQYSNPQYSNPQYSNPQYSK